MSLTKMDMFEQGSPGRRLAMLHRLSMAYLSGPLAEIGVSRGKIGFLLGVLHREGAVQDDLTRSMCIDRAATTRALLDLENKGLIRREEDREDRRCKRVYPTAKARALNDSLVALLADHNEALFAGMDGEEREQLLGLLDRMVENMRAATGKNEV